jgi:hypothetical protein
MFLRFLKILCFYHSISFLGTAKISFEGFFVAIYIFDFVEFLFGILLDHNRTESECLKYYFAKCIELAIYHNFLLVYFLYYK